MTATTRWMTAIGMILGLMAIGCGVDLAKLPPIVISAPVPAAPPPVAEQPKPRATVAFVVVDDLSGQPIASAIATFEDGTQHQANDDGYIAIEKEMNTYQVDITADDYQSARRNVVLTGNRQFTVRLSSTKPAAKPEPPPPPVVTGPPPATDNPTNTPDPADAAKDWSDQQWRDKFFALLKKHKAPPTVNLQTLNDTRADIEALGAEWQHYSSGELRPRLYLPVPAGADHYSRPVDVGLYGEPWTWLKR